MANAYYESTNPDYGKMSISSYVFSEIAQETLEGLAKGALRDDISLSLPGRKKNVACSIVKNQITVDIYFNSIRGSDVQKSVKTIQEEVYNDLYDATEISSIKVNVNLMGFVDKK